MRLVLFTFGISHDKLIRHDLLTIFRFPHCQPQKYFSQLILLSLAGPHLPEFLLPFRKPKRIRTAFSPSQLLKLEQAFEKNQYVVGQERKELAKSLNLSETQVRVKSKPTFLSLLPVIEGLPGIELGFSLYLNCLSEMIITYLIRTSFLILYIISQFSAVKICTSRYYSRNWTSKNIIRAVKDV